MCWGAAGETHAVALRLRALLGVAALADPVAWLSLADAAPAGGRVEMNPVDMTEGTRLHSQACQQRTPVYPQAESIDQVCLAGPPAECSFRVA